MRCAGAGHAADNTYIACDTPATTHGAITVTGWSMRIPLCAAHAELFTIEVDRATERRGHPAPPVRVIHRDDRTPLNLPPGPYRSILADIVDMLESERDGRDTDGGEQ